QAVAAHRRGPRQRDPVSPARSDLRAAKSWPEKGPRPVRVPRSAARQLERSVGLSGCAEPFYSCALDWGPGPPHNRPMIPAALALLFSLTDVRTGRAVPIHEIKSEILVLVFTGARCPISRAYYRVLTDIESTYRDRGVRVLAINSNESESLAQIRRAAEQGGLGLTVLKDVRNALADELRAEYTPEVFVLDRERTLRYHGAIGNSTSP